jgi:drug/metabolite transporter (DMT)-like permease
VSLITWTQQHWSVQGLLYALASGALTSGLGYAIWYRVLPYLPATHAATVQLGVPALAAFGGMVLLGESMTWTLAGASAAILGGIALVMWGRATPG